MDFEKLNSIVSRVLFVGSFLLLAIAVLEKVANVFGYTILWGAPYTAARLLEVASVLLLFVLALLLRQVREELKKVKMH